MADTLIMPRHPAESFPSDFKKIQDHSPPASPTVDNPKHSVTAAPPADISVAELVVREMGIPDLVVHMASAYHQLQHGTAFTDACQLYTAAEDLLKHPEEQIRIGKLLDEAEQGTRKENAQNKFTFKGKDINDACTSSEAVRRPTVEMQKKALVQSESVVEDKGHLKEKVRKLAEENHKLRQRKMCRACRNVDLASSGVTFLPCGHFITCESCSETFDDCPACGKSIMGTVRTFLS